MGIQSLSIAVVCSSNMNRSMEAHAFLSKKGFKVKSFGTGDKVKLPGTAVDRPNVYDFAATYEEIYQDLQMKDRALYATLIIDYNDEVVIGADDDYAMELGTIVVTDMELGNAPLELHQ